MEIVVVFILTDARITAGIDRLALTTRYKARETHVILSHKVYAKQLVWFSMANVNKFL